MYFLDMNELRYNGEVGQVLVGNAGQSFGGLFPFSGSWPTPAAGSGWTTTQDLPNNRRLEQRVQGSHADASNSGGAS